MKKIHLANNKGIALVDDEDYDLLNQYKWYNNIGYARTWVYINNKKIMKYMHQVLINTIKNEIDHIDGNGLNNQKDNLRIVTRSQNNMNRTKRKGTSSKYKGVYFDIKRNKWSTEITFNSKKIFLGRFKDEIEAAKVYNKKAKELFKEYARLNIIGD